MNLISEPAWTSPPWIPATSSQAGYLTPDLCTTGRESAHSLPQDLSTSLSAITMSDVVAALNPTNTPYPDSSTSSKFLPAQGLFTVSADEARTALKTVEHYLNQVDCPSSFDHLCLEHLRERVSDQALRIIMQANL